MSYVSISLVFLTIISFAALLYYLENLRRTIVWYINDTVRFGAEDRESYKKRKELGFYRGWMKYSIAGDVDEVGSSAGMGDVLIVAIVAIILGAIFSFAWPLSVPVGLVAGWAVWEKKKRQSQKKTKEEKVEELKRQLEELEKE